MIINPRYERKHFIMRVNSQQVAEVAAPDIVEAIRVVLCSNPGIPFFDLALANLDMSKIEDQVFVFHFSGNQLHKSIFCGMTIREVMEEAKAKIPITSLRLLVSDQVAMWSDHSAMMAA